MPTLTAAGTFVLGKDARVLLAPSLTINNNNNDRLTAFDPGQPG